MIGTAINERYRIDGELGKGGMGIVYQAYDTTLRRDVALKLLSNAHIGAEGKARLLREAQTIAQLDHPNIVTVYDAGDYGGSPYIVMQLVEGGTLHDRRPGSLDEIVHIIKQVCTALEHAHQHGIIHRDLKPENVALSEDGTAKLMDFGLARSVTSRMTQEGTIVGTVFYMAPEQALGHELDARADLYSLGVMLYELSTGRLPFEGDGPVAVITQHLNAPVVPPRTIREEIPGYLENLILKLLEKEPEERVESAAAVLQILESPEEAEESLRESKELSVLDRIVRGRIVGRKDEYEEARSLWLEVISGSGQTLLISGEPGIGKTRLIREVVTQSEVTGGRVLIGEAYEESNSPYGPFAQMVRTAISEPFHNGLQLPDFLMDDLLEIAPELRPYYPDVQPNPPLDPEARQRRLFENMVSFCTLLSEKEPLLVVLDDAHWADSSSIALFQHLARRTQRLPVMLLAAYREVELSEARPFNEMLVELNRQRLGQRIKLSRLDREQTGAMLEAIFTEEITPDFLEGIFRETDGNPFFIEEICRSLVETGKLYFADGLWHRPSMDELEIPQGLQVAVESRLGKLPEDVQEILRMAAVLGREFDYEVLIKAVDYDEDAVIDAIEAADRAQMVQEGRTDTLFEFVHALVPQSIRENTHRLRRRKLHRQAAAAYEAVQPGNYEYLAYHFSNGGEDEQALRCYTLAGNRALENFANQDAEDHFISALNLTDDPAQKADLLARLGEAESGLGRYTEAVSTWERAIGLLQEQGRHDTAGELYAFSARAIWEAGDTQSSLVICRQGLSALKGSPDGPGLAQLLSETARVCYFNGLEDEVEFYADRALEIAEKFDLLAVQANCLITLGTSRGPGAEDGIPLLEEAVQIAEGADLLTEAMRANNNLGVLQSARGDFEAAVKRYRRAAEIARQKSDLNNVVFFSANEIWTRLPLGQIGYVDREIGVLRKLLNDLPDPGSGGRTLSGVELQLFFTKGDFKRTLELADQINQVLRETNDLYLLHWSLFHKANALSLLGDLAGAQEALEEAIVAASGFATRDMPYFWASAVASKQGDLRRAKELLAITAESMADSQPVFWRQAYFLKAQAQLYAAERNWDEAWSKFKEFERLTIGKSDRFDATWNSLEWADAYLFRGEAEDRVRAQELLVKARKEFDKMGAAGWVELIDGKLAKLEESS